MFSKVNGGELESFIHEKVPAKDQRWEFIARYPFTSQSVDELKAHGLEVRTLYLGEFFLGRYLKPQAERVGYVYLNSILKGYDRDVTLFHELGHAWFEYSVGFGFPDMVEAVIGAETNEAMIEWLARQWRATPQLLCHTIRAFSLEEQVYDAVSRKAFALKK